MWLGDNSFAITLVYFFYLIFILFLLFFDFLNNYYRGCGSIIQGTFVCIRIVYPVFIILLPLQIIISHIFDLTVLLDSIYYTMSVKDIPVFDGGDGLFTGIKLGRNMYGDHPWFLENPIPKEVFEPGVDPNQLTNNDYRLALEFRNSIIDYSEEVLRSYRDVVNVETIKYIHVSNDFSNNNTLLDSKLLTKSSYIDVTNSNPEISRKYVNLQLAYNNLHRSPNWSRRVGVKVLYKFPRYKRSGGFFSNLGNFFRRRGGGRR